MLNSTGSIDFFRPIQNNISFLDQLERAYTMDSYKINMENRDEEFNRVYNKQVKKTLDSCRDYLESRKTKGWTEKGNERFNNILKFYGRYRKEDAQRILNESDRYNVTEKNMQISLAREFKLEMRKLNNEAKSKDNNQEIKEKAPAKKVVNVQKI